MALSASPGVSRFFFWYNFASFGTYPIHPIPQEGFYVR